MANPTLKQVKPKLKTAINASIVNIAMPSFRKISKLEFYMNRGSQSLYRGLTAYRIW